MPDKMRKFPTEIFIAIFSFLPPRDLVSVIRLCKALIGVGRSLLYRSVDLKGDGRHIRSTVLLLRQENELSRNIMHATLTTRQPCQTSWIPPNFLNRWNNLRSLKLVGFPFRTLKDQEVFRNTLTRSCTSLVHFAYQPDASPFPGESFEISGLKQLCWKTEQESK
jgi:F-box-like